MPYERAFSITRRLRRLIPLIRSGRFSTPALAKRLKVSEQTIYRDIDCLKEKGYSIRSVRLSKGWAYKLLAESEMVTHGGGVSLT